jgi:small neutral amino acid transporter SnatA (MarC family)
MRYYTGFIIAVALAMLVLAGIVLMSDRIAELAGNKKPVAEPSTTGSAVKDATQAPRR